MSADNGVYILRTPRVPKKEGNALINQHDQYEFRVAECQAIENIYYSDLYMPLLFGDCKVFYDYADAMKEACRLADKAVEEGYFLEYGIGQMTKDSWFPNMTRAAARKALDCYEGDKPLDYLDGFYDMGG